MELQVINYGERKSRESGDLGGRTPDLTNENRVDKQASISMQFPHDHNGNIQLQFW